MDDAVLRVLIEETVARAVDKVRAPTLMPATVTDGAIPRVLVDGDTTDFECPTICGSVATGMRVMVLFYPPSGAVIVGVPSGPLPGDDRWVNVTGDTMAVDAILNWPGASPLGQRLGIYGTTFGIGIQSSCIYFRTGVSAASDFAWFRGGVHSDTNEDPGAGGVLGMVLRSDGLYLPDASIVNLVLGASATTGQRIRFNTPAGNINYCDFDGATAEQGFLRFRQGTATPQTVLELGPTINTSNQPFYNTGQVRCAGTVNPLLLADGGAGPYMSFYDGLSTVSPGTRKGYMGYNSSTTMAIVQELGAVLQIRCTNAAGFIDFYTANAFQARIDTSGNLLHGKSVSDATTLGIELLQTGTIQATRLDSGTPYVCNKQVGTASGSPMFGWRVDNVTIGTVSRNAATSAVLYNTTSHGPWKGDVEDLDDEAALTRLASWRPVAFRWKWDDKGRPSSDGTPQGEVQHGFIAQELVQSQPTAVTPGHGDEAEHRAWLDEPDGDEPDFLPWQVDASNLIPDMVAAMQAMMRQIEALQSKVAALEAAAA